MQLGQPHGLPGHGGQHAAPGQGVPPGQGLPPGPNVPAQGVPSGLQRPGTGLGMSPGQPGAGQNGLAPLDPQRGMPPQRPTPAANGMPYPPDRGGTYGGQGQYGAPGQGSSYSSAPYSGPQQPVSMAAPPVAISVGEAVQSAHAEGFGFGEAVARDAPALWLEAVLARKPRMPSDLEARLLQGSALPIDSLLHDEVRHALRRGFWDALERSRH
jgi:hypothetical protein